MNLPQPCIQCCTITDQKKTNLSGESGKNYSDLIGNVSQIVGTFSVQTIFRKWYPKENAWLFYVQTTTRYYPK